jgi:hypothetical protein
MRERIRRATVTGLVAAVLLATGVAVAVRGPGLPGRSLTLTARPGCQAG